jgi:hypothetical protein
MHPWTCSSQFLSCNPVLSAWLPYLVIPDSKCTGGVWRLWRLTHFAEAKAGYLHRVYVPLWMTEGHLHMHCMQTLG